MAHDGSGSAYPIVIPEGGGCGPESVAGMSYRQWLAGMAMQGLLSNLPESIILNAEQLEKSVHATVRMSLAIADLMVEQGGRAQW